MTEQERIEELISLYALGVLEGEELKEAEELINEGSPEVLSLLNDYEKVVSMMSYSTPAVAPDPSLRKRLLSELKQGLDTQRESAVESHGPSFWDRIQPMWLTIGGAVAAAVILILFVSNLSLRGGLNDRASMIAELKERITSQEQEIESLKGVILEDDKRLAALEAEIASQEELVSFLHDPDVVIVKLTDTHPVHNPGGRVHWDKDDNDALFVSYNLPEAPEGKTYQWWVVADGTPKNAGIFKIDPDGKSFHKIGSLSDFGNIQKFLLTLEPEGGAESPSQETLLIGESI